MSNSKLAPAQKIQLKSLRVMAAQAHIAVFAFSNGVTVALREFPENPASRTLRFTVSIASPEEKKARRKVGEFYALQAMADGRGEPVSWDGMPVESLSDCALRIAETLGDALWPIHPSEEQFPHFDFVGLTWESDYENLE